MIRRRKIRDSRRRKSRSVCLLRLEGRAFLLALVVFFIACMVGCHYMIYYTLTLYMKPTVTERSTATSTERSVSFMNKIPLDAVQSTKAYVVAEETNPKFSPHMEPGKVLRIHNGRVEALEHFGLRVSTDKMGNVQLDAV